MPYDIVIKDCRRVFVIVRDYLPSREHKVISDGWMRIRIIVRG